MRVQSLSVAAVLLLSLNACRESSEPVPTSPTLARAQAGVPAPYHIVDIAVDANEAGYGYDINDHGNIAIASILGAFLRLPDGTRIPMGTLRGGGHAQAYGLNNLDEATGFASTDGGPAHAMQWSRSQGMIDLGSLVGRRGISLGNGINILGEVVGESDAALNRSLKRPFLWTPQSQTMTDLGSFGGTHGAAWDINDRSEVVGVSALPTGPTHAFLWTRAGGMVDLGTLGGPSSGAYGINNRGEVVGWSDLSNGEMHAFKWTGSGGMVDMGGLAGFNNQAWDINERGQIVGTANGQSDNRGFTIRPGGPVLDLGDLGNGGSFAIGINRCGQIVGAASPPTGGTPPALWDKPC